MTMVDGKVCNALANNPSSQKCYICGATPKMINEKLKSNRASNSDMYTFGISSLHAWIRTLECLLHISYRLHIKKWQIRDSAEKILFQERKLKIQEKFKQEMGLIVDRPKAGGGNTNDGNTARRFFRNSVKSAEITGLNENLIRQFGIILQTISCGYEINVNLFANYVENTRQLYISLYPWYYMPASIHKILVHSPEIINSCILPIGQMSEEALEARNKDCRRYRENNTRKISRWHTNKDLLSMLLISSDSLISSLRTSTQHKHNTNLFSDVLLANPTVSVAMIEADNSTSDIENNNLLLSDNDTDSEYD